MDNKTRDFKYGVVSPLHALLMVVVASILPLACANLATGDPQRLKLLGGLIRLAPGFMWLLVIAGTFAAFYTLAFAISSFRAPKFVQLAASHATFPKASLLGGRLKVPYAEISDIQYKETNGRHKVIVIQSSLGKAKLLASHFNGLPQFENFLSVLRERVGG